MTPVFPIIQPLDDEFELFDILLGPVKRHVANSDALFSGMYEILTIPHYRNDWNPQRIEETHELLEALGVPTRTICHDRQLAVAPIDFCDEQEVGDAVRRSVNIDSRRQYRYQYAGRVARYFA